MVVSKLFEPGEIRRLSKDETIALYKRHMLAQHERAEAAEARCARLQQALDALKAEVPRYLTTLRETLGNELTDDWRTPANRTCREYAARQALRALDELEERLGAYRDALQAAEHNECEHDWVREHGSAESFCLVCGAGPVLTPEEER